MSDVGEGTAFERDAASLADLEAVICQGAANLTAAEHAWLVAVAEFDRREGWAQWGCVSCAAWLSWQVGVDRRTAHDKVRVARALVEYPLISAAMAAGTLSYAKVRAITRIVDPATEADLVAMALAGTSNHVERIVAGFRRSERACSKEQQRQHAERAVTTGVDPDGRSMVITVRLPAEEGMALLGGIDAFVTNEPSIPLSQRRADALVEAVEHGFGHRGKPVPAGAGSRYLATGLLDPAVLVGDDNDDDEDAVRPVSGEGVAGVCVVAAGDGSRVDGGAMAKATARRLTCDAAIELLVAGTKTCDHDHEHHDGCGTDSRLSQRHDLVRGRLRRIVRVRDGGCRFPGCTRRGWIDVHHIIHRADGGITVETNVMCLCRFHHRMVHEGRWTIEGDALGAVFVRPDGTRIPATPITPPGDRQAVDDHDRTPADGRCQWGGEPLDLGIAVSGLHHLRELWRRKHGQPDNGG